jgi:hypothetical protein
MVVLTRRNLFGVIPFLEEFFWKRLYGKITILDKTRARNDSLIFLKQYLLLLDLDLRLKLRAVSPLRHKLAQVREFRSLRLG